MDKLINLRRYLNRSTFANALMVIFVVSTSIGAGMMFLPAGFVVAGVTSGIFGYLLGAE
jgi:amino acid permease